jgi:DNA (cytosine-5)-methyltransferase 1
VAAVAIAHDDRTPGQRYFDHEERQIVARLRRNVGTWNEIATLDRPELAEKLSEATNRRGIGERRVERLDALLSAVAECSKTEGVTLKNIRGMQYSSLCDLLADFPGVSRSDAWWLLLVAFDKPVWPAGPFVDGLLCSLGLLNLDRFHDGSERRGELEEELTDRQLAPLHRALAGHAVKGDVDACDESCEIRKFLLSHRLRRQSEEDTGPVVIDLFSGAGGISLGFDRAGCNIDWAIDNNQDATDTYRLNHPEIPHRNVVCNDIRDAVESGAMEDLERTPDILVGGPPCQSLSLAGYRSRRSDDDDYSILEDDRTALYTHYVEFVEELRPKALVMENVEGMFNEVGDTGVKVGDLVMDALGSIGGADSGYACDYRLLDCSKLGIPQKRERAIILGVREDFAGGRDEIDELFDRLFEVKPVDEYDLQQGLSGLPKIRRGEGGPVVAGTLGGVRSRYVVRNDLDSGTDLCFNHQAREHPMEKDRTLFDEALEPGDTGWDVKYDKDGEYGHLIEYDVGTKENPRFKDKYRMLCWDEPSPTIVAHLAKDANSFVLPDYYEHANGVTGEPDSERNRGITPREAARLQSFPDSYIFLGAFTSWFCQIGNAIPPLLGERIALAVREHLSEKGIPRMEAVQTSTGQVSTDD